MHNITYLDFSFKEKFSKIETCVQNYISNSGDGYGTEYIRRPTETVFDTYDEAYEYIYSVDKYSYDGIAVKYRDYSNVKDSKKIEEYKNRLSELQEKKRKYEEVHSVRNQKASYIGCQKCGSKLSREYLKGEVCPLCRNDLRSVSTLEKLSLYEKKMKELEQKIVEEQKKQKSKSEVRWLVKFEYHS